MRNDVGVFRAGRRVPAALAALAVGACAAVGAGTASAEGVEAQAIPLDFEVAGSTWVSKPDSEIALGPGSLHIELDAAQGTLTGDLALPPAESSFNAFDLVPTTATVEFLPTEPVTGTLVSGEVTAVSKLNLRLSDVKAGFLPLPAGDECLTSTPITVNMKSEPGFDPLQGGNLVGTYEIPEFANCQIAQVAINSLVPGPDNTITLAIDRVE